MNNKFDQLITDIKASSGLDHQEATGFYAIYCPVCNKKTKKTGGFKFEDDKIVYNCFRGSCDASCVYTYGEYISKKFKHLMSCIGVTIPAELRVVRNSIQDQIKRELESSLYEKVSYKNISKPDGDMSSLIKQTDSVSKKWIKHFESRKVPIDDMFIIESGKYRDNCFLPFYFYGKMIGGQIITDKGYIAHNDGNEHVFYTPSGDLNFETVFVVEGAMDAKCFPQTFATLRHDISKEQAYHIRNKRVIMIPDRSGGNSFHKQFHKYGWEMCVPPWKEKDLNAAVKKYGCLVVYRMIMDNVYKDKVKAEAAFRMWEIK